MLALCLRAYSDKKNKKEENEEDKSIEYQILKVSSIKGWVGNYCATQPSSDSQIVYSYRNETKFLQ